ncbi:guanylate kinase [Gammaproteobacteria bacterium]|nr:guanylate kinase [Gammaproteobacteria bacterium]
MNRKDSSNFFVISAPSGAGKTSLVKALIDQKANCRAAISHTTRPRRSEETDRKDYYFVSENEFSEIEAKGGFLESAKIFDYSYGTSLEEAHKIMRSGMTLILEIDWQGALQVKKKYKDSKSIFILPPSLGALRSRLKTRAQDSDETVEKRMKKAISESSKWTNFDYLVENDVFQTALEAIGEIISGKGEKYLRAAQENRLKALFNRLKS